MIHTLLGTGILNQVSNLRTQNDLFFICIDQIDLENKMKFVDNYSHPQEECRSKAAS